MSGDMPTQISPHLMSFCTVVRPTHLRKCFTAEMNNSNVHPCSSKRYVKCCFKSHSCFIVMNLTDSKAFLTLQFLKNYHRQWLVSLVLLRQLFNCVFLINSYLFFFSHF